MPPPVVSFLSDYGHDDEFVGVCHGVIARGCPSARIIDLAHGIPAGDVQAGAIVLRDTLPYMPAGVHLAVVDPGVGGPRRAVALRTAEEERILVGPDNGLLLPAAERFGGAIEAVDLGDSPISRTFHGRDVFAPAAAALAGGAMLADVGQRFVAATLVRLALSEAALSGGALNARVVRVDRFGNVILDASGKQLRELGPESLSLEHAGRTHVVKVARAFADVARGELLVYEDAWGWAALAVNGGSAAALLGGASPGEVVVLRRTQS